MNTKICPTCNAPIPANAPGGFCPACLLRDAAEPAPTERAMPPLEEIAAAFPQLEVEAMIGRGGMGIVYKARQKSLNRPVALKLLAPERVTDAAFAQRFTREAHALAALNHPNIVTIHDFGQAGGFFFLLMEYVDGVNLRQAMKAGRFAPEQALAIVPPVCEALQYAHEHGIVHRDIKPENLLLDREGRVKIADFGIAKMLGDDSATGLAESQPAGTPQYMAPEQKEHRRTDHRADIYSLGVVLYELLTGELPAGNLQPPSRKVQIDVRLDEIVLRALESKPELRFQTAADFRTQVEATVATPAAVRAGAVPSSPPPRFLKAGTSTLTTPAELATARGQFFCYRTRGQLILDDRQLTHARAGATTVIPLVAIRDVSVGQFPRSMNPAGLALLSVTYEEAGERKQVLLSPMKGWFAFPSAFDAHITEWLTAIREAVRSATGNGPTLTPQTQLGLPGSNIAMLLGIFGVPLAVAMILIGFIRFLRPTSPPISTVTMPADVVVVNHDATFLLIGIAMATAIGFFIWRGVRGPQDTRSLPTGEPLTDGKNAKWSGWGIIGTAVGLTSWIVVTTILSGWSGAGVALSQATVGIIFVAALVLWNARHRITQFCGHMWLIAVGFIATALFLLGAHWLGLSMISSWPGGAMVSPLKLVWALWLFPAVALRLWIRNANGHEPPTPENAERQNSSFTAVALTIVWWFAAFPFVSYAADALRRSDTHIVSAVLMLIALPIFGSIAKGSAEAWIAAASGRRWLRAFSILGWLLALPAIGFAAFFFYSALSESGGWHPAPSEALVVPVICLGAVLLPIAAMVLWRGSSERPGNAASTAMRAVGGSLLCGLCFAGGLAILKQAPYGGGKVDAQLMPVRVVGRAVIVRLITGEKSAIFELRPTLESPGALGTDAAESFSSEIVAFRQEKGPGLFITPRDRVGSPVAVTLGARFDAPIAFVLPTPELAQQAFENLRGLAPIDLTPDRLHRAIVFEVGRYIGALRFSTPIRQGHARWAEIRALPHVETPSTLDLSWELRTSRPAAFTLSHRDPLGGGGEAMNVINQTGPERHVYQQTARVILYQISPTRVGLRTILGNQPNTAEFDGDFATLAGEMRRVRFMQNLRTERDWDIELCRVAGNPVLVRIADPPPPHVMKRVEPPNTAAASAAVEASDGLSLFAPAIGAGLPANVFRAATILSKPRHVAVLTLEAESAGRKETLSEQSYYHVVLDDSKTASTTASWTADTRPDGLVSFRLEVTGAQAKSKLIDFSSPVKWLNGFEWTPERPTRSYWVGPGEWNLNETNTLPIFHGVKRGDPSQKAVIRLHFALYRLPEGFQPAKSGQVFQNGTNWRTDLGLPADAIFAPIHLKPEGKVPVGKPVPNETGASKSATAPIPEDQPLNASVIGRLLDAQGKPIAQRRLLILNPIIEATHQQSQIFAEVRTGDDGGFNTGLPMGKPFVVVMPRNSANNGPTPKGACRRDGSADRWRQAGSSFPRAAGGFAFDNPATGPRERGRLPGTNRANRATPGEEA